MSNQTETVSLELVVQQQTKENGIQPETGQELLQSFREHFDNVYTLVEEAKAVTVTEFDQVTEMKKSRELRLALAKVRVKANKLREELKSEGLRRNAAIQGIYNVLKFMTEPVEQKLLENEQFAERAEAARIQLLKETRAATIAEYGDPSVYNLELMSDDDFSDLAFNLKTRHEAQIEKAAKLEQERLAQIQAEKEEQARIKAENEKLAKEKAELEAKIEAERKLAQEAADARSKAEREAYQQAAEKARKEQEDAINAERKAAEAKAAELRRQQDEREALKAKELAEANARHEAAVKLAEIAKEDLRKEQERVAAEKQAAENAYAETVRKQLEADRKRVKDEEDAKRKAEAAPDKDRLKQFGVVLKSLELPALATEAGKAAGIRIQKAVNELLDVIRDEYKKL